MPWLAWVLYEPRLGVASTTSRRLRESLGLMRDPLQLARPPHTGAVNTTALLILHMNGHHAMAEIRHTRKQRGHQHGCGLLWSL